MNSANKQDKQYNSVFSDSTKAGHKTSEGISKTKRRKKRRNTSEKRRAAKERELNEKFLRNLSTHQLSDDQVNVLSRGLKFIPTPVTNKTIIRRQLLRDFEQFARRMRLQYIFRIKRDFLKHKTIKVRDNKLNRRFGVDITPLSR